MIDREGFLSSNIEQWIIKNRQEHINWFEFVKKLNHIAQKLLTDTNVTTDEAQTADPALLGFLLFSRTLSNFQGSVLLAERGMVVEARTLARSCTENLLYMAALSKKGVQFVSEMLHAEIHSRKTRGKFILENKDLSDSAGHETQERLKNTVIQMQEDFGKTSDIKIKELAIEVGLETIYLYFRQLSADAAHPSVDSLNRYLKREDRDQVKRNLQWGPNCGAEFIPDTLLIASTSMIGACIALNDLLGKSSENHPLFTLADELQKLPVERAPTEGGRLQNEQ